MIKRRKKKLHWIFGPSTGCLVAALIPFGGCLGCCVWNFYPTVTHEIPRILATRNEGNVIQRVVLEHSIKTTARFFPGPHGPTSNREYSHKYFYDETGQPRRELIFLEGDLVPHYCEHCRPVDNSSLWVMVREKHVLSVLVFNGTEVLHRRTFNYIIDPKHEGNDLRFENGNRLVVYRTAQGFEAYDVIADTVAPWKPVKK